MSPSSHPRPSFESPLGRRGTQKNYRWPGTYHITINVLDRKQQPLGRITGDASKPDGDPLAPRVLLSDLGRMVEQELLGSIRAHYPMVEVQDYVIMPDHLHFIIVVHRDIYSSTGRPTHLGQVIAGFKKGCNRRYWELTAQSATAAPSPIPSTPIPSSQISTAPIPSSQISIAPIPSSQISTAPIPSSQISIAPISTVPASPSQQGKPAAASPSSSAASPSSPPLPPSSSPAAVSPLPFKVPSAASTGRPPLFDYGYVDVMPLREGQLERQREYIHNNPRYRLLRQTNPRTLTPQRASVTTALTPSALCGYLRRECSPYQFTAEIWEHLWQRLLIADHFIICDSYGNIQLLNHTLLPVVCHRKDASQFEKQKARCLAAAASGAVLVSARIARREQEIMDAAAALGHPVILVEDNGFPAIYHPSEQRTTLCCDNKLLLLTAWHYAYRRVAESITVSECKTMNCIVQALCCTKDSWWKE